MENQILRLQMLRISRPLHIVHGNTEGDKDWLQRAASKGLRSRNTWIVPRSARPGDDVVVYVGNSFFATARVRSEPRRRAGWHNRYGAIISNVRLIKPPISLRFIRRGVSGLAWAKYPRSITTPVWRVADRVRRLIADRRKTRLPDFDKASLQESSLEELRAVALMYSSKRAPKRLAQTIYRTRELAIRKYVLKRANGTCEGCRAEAPFIRADGSPYLEPHHTTRLADEGPDHPDRVIALCPNCHRRAHYGEDHRVFNNGLKRNLRLIEKKLLAG